jgi:hypothetical protein
VARAFPQTTIILNHVGGPLGIGPYADKKQETFAAWRAGIAELGKCQNVVVKLGGLGMLFGMFDFHTRETPPSSEDLARAYKPYIETCIESFGPDRGIFESNFPAGRRQFELRRPVECLRTPGRRLLGRREGQAVQRHGKARLPTRLGDLGPFGGHGFFARRQAAAFGKGPAGVLVTVPFVRADGGKEMLHRRLVASEQLAVEVTGIPIDQNAA